MNPDLTDYIAAARWFGGKGRAWTIESIDRLGVLSADRRVAIDLVTVRYDDGTLDRYQLPVVGYLEPEDRLSHAALGAGDDPDFGFVHLYDALHDREAMAVFLEAFAASSVVDGHLSFIRVEEHPFDLTAHSTLFSGEQSNSSVMYGEDSVLKLYRRITPGENPDVTVQAALTRAGSEHVPHLYGWLEAPSPHDEGVLHLGMLQQFLRTASDGWDLAQTSVRNLFVEADLHAEEVGGDFAGEAARLGTALAEVHRGLQAEFSAQTRDRSAADDLATMMHSRLDAAIAAVPELAGHESRLRAVFDEVRQLERIDIQRIHGDLHLGQTLRTVRGWKIVDFEGEPAKSLAERQLPDSPWRDVAGMLRSLDYAPRVVSLTSLPPDTLAEAEQQDYRAREWVRRNTLAFVDAYVGGRSLTSDEQVLLRAYTADKAVYEAVYEARNRPSWLSIPLAALERMETS